MNLIKRLLIFLLIIVGLVFLSTRVKPNIQTAVTIPSPGVISKQITLIIDYGDSHKSTHIRQYSASQSAFTLLKDVASEQNLPFSFKQYSFGTLVESINNVKNSTARAWIYFVNSKSSDVGADQYSVQPGDLIEWRYIKPQ